MKRIYKFIIATVLTVSFGSCSSFLDREPRYQKDISTAVVDYSGAVAVLNGVYYTLEDYFMGGQIFMRMASQTGISSFSTAYSGETATDTDLGFTQIWSALYRTINASNVAIKSIANLKTEAFPSPLKKQEMLAEARCVRGFAYFYLHCLYSRWWDEPDSPYGIIYRDRKAEYYETQLGRLTVGESYQKILDDLDEAIKNCPDYTANGRRATKQFAMALKAKLLLLRATRTKVLNRTDADAALKLLDDVVAFSSANTYCLATTLKNHYDASWDSRENLFCRYLEAGTTNMRYWYEVAYSQSIITQIPTEPFYSRLKADPRYSTVIGSVVSISGNVERTYPDAVVKLCRQGYYRNKEDLYTAYYMRYAEVLLMQAELRARLNPGDIENALTPLNIIIKRAGGTELDTNSVADNQELMDAIYNQYIMELFYENGSEFYASLRFFESNGFEKLLTMRNKTAFSMDRIAWQIPAVETTPNKLAEKNPGY